MTFQIKYFLKAGSNVWIKSYNYELGCREWGNSALLTHGDLAYSARLGSAATSAWEGRQLQCRLGGGAGRCMKIPTLRSNPMFLSDHALSLGTTY